MFVNVIFGAIALMQLEPKQSAMGTRRYVSYQPVKSHLMADLTYIFNY